MILEIAILSIKKGLSHDFEKAFAQSEPLISCQVGYLSHELRKCMEQNDKYLLQVQWESLENHTIGFRSSVEYQQWKNALHHFYDPFPIVEHYI